MLLKLIENLKIENTKVTVEYKEQNEQVNKIIYFLEHLEEMENSFTGSANGKILTSAWMKFFILNR